MTDNCWWSARNWEYLREEIKNDKDGSDDDHDENYDDDDYDDYDVKIEQKTENVLLLCIFFH